VSELYLEWWWVGNLGTLLHNITSQDIHVIWCVQNMQVTWCVALCVCYFVVCGHFLGGEIQLSSTVYHISAYACGMDMLCMLFCMYWNNIQVTVGGEIWHSPTLYHISAYACGMDTIFLKHARDVLSRNVHVRCCICCNLNLNPKVVGVWEISHSSRDIISYLSIYMRYGHNVFKTPESYKVVGVWEIRLSSRSCVHNINVMSCVGIWGGYDSWAP